MDIHVPSVISMMPFRVLVEFDTAYQEWTATCLDTGAVATGETAEEAEAQIQSLLANDIRMAIEDKSIKSLDRRKAPTEVFARWYQLQADNGEVRQVPLDVLKELVPRKGPQSVTIIRYDERIAR